MLIEADIQRNRNTIHKLISNELAYIIFTFFVYIGMIIIEIIVIVNYTNYVNECYNIYKIICILCFLHVAIVTISTYLFRTIIHYGDESFAFINSMRPVYFSMLYQLAQLGLTVQYVWISEGCVKFYKKNAPDLFNVYIIEIYLIIIIFVCIILNQAIREFIICKNGLPI
jgi:hypothetical protein